MSVVSRFVRIRFKALLRGFQSLNIVLPWNLIEVVISCDHVERAETGFNCEESTLDQLRRGSSSNFADHRYCLELSTSSIASFEPGSIALRSLSIFVVPSGSRVVDLRLIAGFPALFLGLRHVAGFPALSADYVASLEFPRCRRSSGLPQDSRAFVDLRDQASISRVYDLPRLSRWSYIIIEFFCVTRLNLSGLKLISSLVLKK